MAVKKIKVQGEKELINFASGSGDMNTPEERSHERMPGEIEAQGLVRPKGGPQADTPASQKWECEICGVTGAGAHSMEVFLRN